MPVTFNLRDRTIETWCHYEGCKYGDYKVCHTPNSVRLYANQQRRLLDKHLKEAHGE